MARKDKKIAEQDLFEEAENIFYNSGIADNIRCVN